MKRGLRPPFQFCPTVIQGSKVSSYYLSVLDMIPLNSPNSGMDKGHIWVWSTIETKRKPNESKREDFE